MGMFMAFGLGSVAAGQPLATHEYSSLYLEKSNSTQSACTRFDRASAGQVVVQSDSPSTRRTAYETCVVDALDKLDAEGWLLKACGESG